MLLIVALALSLGSLQVSSAQSTGNTCGVAICFAIDKSASIGAANFPKAQEFVVDVINGVSDIATGEKQVICKHPILLVSTCQCRSSLAKLSMAWTLIESNASPSFHQFPRQECCQSVAHEQVITCCLLRCTCHFAPQLLQLLNLVPVSLIHSRPLWRVWTA